MKRLLKYLLFMCLCILIFEFNSYAATIILNSGITIKEKPINRTDEEQLQQKRKLKKIRIMDREDLLYELQPEIGPLPGVSYPFGKLGTRLDPGYGATLFCDLQLPMKPAMFKVRIGLSAGFMYHRTKATDAAARLYLVPITAYAKFQTVTIVVVRPYVKPDGGIAPVFGSEAPVAPPSKK